MSKTIPIEPTDEEGKKFYKILKKFIENEKQTEKQFQSLNSFERKKYKTF